MNPCECEPAVAEAAIPPSLKLWRAKGGWQRESDVWIVVRVGWTQCGRGLTVEVGGLGCGGRL